jgi:hypothetical protein
MPDQGDDFSQRIDLAVLMIAAQVDCSPGEALNRLLIRAAPMDQSLEHTALDALDGEIRFDDNQ